MRRIGCGGRGVCVCVWGGGGGGGSDELMFVGHYHATETDVKPKYKIQTRKRFNRTLLIKTTHSMRTPHFFFFFNPKNNT